MHFNGADTSTTMTDVKGHAAAAFGNAQIDTDQSKFGGSSLLLDGSGDYVTVTVNSDIQVSSEAFTFECWIRPASITGIDSIATNRAPAGSDYNWWLYLNAGKLTFQSWGPTPGTGLVTMADASARSVGAWVHVAVTRSGSSWRLFVEGAEVANATNASNIVGWPYALAIGRDPSTAGREFHGHIDEMRFTFDRARYTAPFTPPSTPFPDS